MKRQPISTSRTTAKLHLTILFSSFMRVCRFLRYFDDELSAHVALLEVANRFRRFANWIGLLYYRSHLAFLHEVAQKSQIGLVERGRIPLELLVGEARPQRCSECTCDAV